MIELRPTVACTYDAVALGEVMLRLDPGEGRIRTAREFRVWEGGGEYNLVRGLQSVFGLRTAVLTALVDNEVGRLIEGLVRAGGVDTAWIHWSHHDGIGTTARNGLNFTERGYGVRPPVGVSDRANSAASQMTAEQVDWDHLFGAIGVRWFHTGGIFAALSPSSAATAAAAVAAARRHGTVVSYDLNYRPSLWRTHGGVSRAQEVTSSILRAVDVVFGHPSRVLALLGVDAKEGETFGAAAERLAGELPHLRVIADTRRRIESASSHQWTGSAWSPATGPLDGSVREKLEVLDRVGAGDSFGSGVVCGLLEGTDLTTALEYGLAHGALTMTTPGVNSMATRAEVLSLAVGEPPNFER